MAAGHVVRVKREAIEACIKCPLCNKLLKDATTISLCLHTFCRRCIMAKLADEEVDSCPVCNVDLGCSAVEKLRPDHNLQDIRSKIFPLKRKKIIVSEASPSVVFPAKRKERSLSSLVVGTPKVPVQAGLTGRRSKANVRKTVPFRSSFVADHTFKKEDSEEDKLRRSCSPESSSHTGHDRKQESFNVEPSLIQRSEGVADNGVDVIDRKVDLWTPLNCLVEAANRTKSPKSNLLGLPIAKQEQISMNCDGCSPSVKSKLEPLNGHEVETHSTRTKNKQHALDHKASDKDSLNSLPLSVKRRRLSTARKRGILHEERCSSYIPLLDATRSKTNRKNNPIWFSLVAYEDQKGEAMLPQISSRYLRIKDSKMTVSLIQRYLVKKLDLQNEAEVEILCRGQPVVSTLELHNVVDLWSPKAVTSKKSPLPGSSGKDFVMVLQYCRKRQPF